MIARTAADLAETGIIPDPLIRFGIRRLVARRRREITVDGSKRRGVDVDAFVDMMNRSKIALVPELANEQHYDLPAEFFAAVLGRHRKYSCCYWGGGAAALDDAEQAALELTCRRARIADGMRILDLGCGWGSLSLWAAEHYPGCTVTAVSNSVAQRRFIEAEALDRELGNLRVVTADMNDFDCEPGFDRIVSVEMFEHMRNYGALFERISRWLDDDGRFFMHIFCHRTSPYQYMDAGPSDWMSRNFFSGGMMPSEDLPLRFQQHLAISDQWRWDGRQYQQTAEAWLHNMDQAKSAIMPILEHVYGPQAAGQWWMRWRMFFLAVSEMFGCRTGTEWFVGHYLFRKQRRR